MHVCGDSRKFVQINHLQLTKSKWVNNKYEEFYKKHKYFPEFFDVYNCLEVKNIASTLSTRSNGAMGSGTILIMEEYGRKE